MVGMKNPIDPASAVVRFIGKKFQTHPDLCTDAERLIVSNVNNGSK